MANQQLVDYIKGQIAAGVARIDLEKAVAAAGWSSKDGAEAFAVAEGRVPPAPAVVAAPVAPVSPVAPSAPAAPAQPVAMRPATMQMNVQGTRRRRVWPWIVVVALLVAGLAGAYYYRTPLGDIINFYINGAPPVAPAEQPYTPPLEMATTTATSTPPTVGASTTVQASTTLH